MTRIMTYLAKINIKFMENDPYSLLLLQDNEKITVESVQGISGLHLVKFNTNNPLNESIIEILSK